MNTAQTKNLFILPITERAMKEAIEPNSIATATVFAIQLGLPKLNRSIKWTVDIIEEIKGTEIKQEITIFLKVLLFIF